MKPIDKLDLSYENVKKYPIENICDMSELVDQLISSHNELIKTIDKLKIDLFYKDNRMGYQEPKLVKLDNNGEPEK